MMMNKLFAIPFVGNTIKNVVVSIEQGHKKSKSLRKFCLEKYKVEVGLHSYGSCFSKNFNTGGSVSIGRYCSFGPNVRYFGANHPIEKAIMSPYFYNRRFSGFIVEDIKREHLTIGNDVWIGANVIILSKCHMIGNGAVIGAGSIVTADVPPYAIVVGNPGHLIKYRFDEKTKSLLEKSEWWKYEPQELIQFYECMDVPTLFADRIMSYRK